jgi:hypothetical protein
MSTLDSSAAGFNSLIFDKLDFIGKSGVPKQIGTEPLLIRQRLI